MNTKYRTKHFCKDVFRAIDIQIQLNQPLKVPVVFNHNNIAMITVTFPTNVIHVSNIIKCN